ncbi:hypothetical protein [Microbacterium sp. P02]|uniref:hypothetical protein n=1 Tax=Microbacterium sp. P02 TaxID=3366260 RepID=UPI00366EC774
MTRRTPVGLGAHGRRLWCSVVDENELAEAEAVQLEEACRVRDTVVSLRAQVTKDGVMIPSSQGARLHPAIAEIRAQQLALARLLATLGIPALTEDEDETPASRGVRGVYALRSAS